MKLTILFLLLSFCVSAQKINYTVNNGLQIQGVDATNPTIEDNDMAKDTPDVFYLMLKANRKEVNLVGLISSHNGHPQANPSEQPEPLFQQFNEVYNTFKAAGGQNVPAPVRGSRKNLTNGQTNPEVTAGAQLIIAEAKKASPAKPLVIFLGGQATTTANAILMDASIIPNIIVFHVNGWDGPNNTNFNAIDGWSCQLLIDKGVKYVVWDGQLNSWYDQAGSPNYRGSYNPPIKRMEGITFTNINNGFHNMYKGNFTHMYDAYGSIGDAPPVFYFFNHSLWQNVVRKNKSNQTVTDDNFAFLLISQNNWTQYGPQLSGYMNNPVNYIPVTTPTPPVNNPPIVTTTMGALFNAGDVTLSASASDSDGSVSKVEFLVNGSKVGEDFTAPYSLVQNLVPGSYGVQARATDNLGAVGNSASLIITVVGVTPPPIDSTDCPICPKGADGKGIANTTVTSDGRIIITYTDGTTYTSQSVTGPPGVCPICPGGGTGTGSVLEKTYWVTDYGALSNGSFDDTKAFQDAFNTAAINKGIVVIPAPNVFYKLTNTINVRPPAGQGQVRISVVAWGWGSQGTNAIRYMGASNKSVFYIVGLKTSHWSGITLTPAAGLSGVTLFDLDTEGMPVSSSTGTTFSDMYLDLGDGNNNVGFRYGHKKVTTGGDDVSNITMSNIAIYGQRKPGQVAYLNEGHNTLHLQWDKACFTAYCDKLFSNSGSAGRGNGSVYFFGMGASQNNIDYDFNFEQTYTISGGRYEGGKIFMRVPDFAQVSPNILVENVTIGDYSDSDGLFQCAVPANITLENVYMNQTDGGSYTNPVTVSSSQGVGSLVMINCSISTTNNFPYSKTGGTWQVTTFGNTRMGPAAKVRNDSHYPAEFAIVK